MKFKRAITITALIAIIFTIPVMALPTKKGPIFMGEIIEVTRDEQFDTLRLLVRGYIKGCEVYEEELVALVTEETKIIENKCIVGSGESSEKVTYKNLQASKGDKVFIILSEAMTKSMPPQSSAQAIQVSKMPQ